MIENTLAQQHAPICPPTNVENQENLAVAIYGLPEYDDVTKTTNQLFADMHLGFVTCVSVHRTPKRLTRPGVVIAQLRSLSDKHAILERKRSLRSHPLYRDVYIKSSKSHAEQVMDANFNVVLNEMSNGEAYYISDNGRIMRKPSDINMHDNRNNGTGETKYTDQSRYRSNYGGARPKNTYYHNYADATKARQDSDQYGYRNRYNQRTRDNHAPAQHTEGYNRNRPEQHTQRNEHPDRQHMDLNRHGLQRTYEPRAYMQMSQPHSEVNRPISNSLTQLYNDKFSTPHTQQHRGAEYYMDPTKK